MSDAVSNAVFRGLSFLIVDDEPDNLGVVARLLTLMGGQVQIATNGQDGLDKARIGEPNVILADLSMPVMTGWQMLHEIKHDPQLQNIPVVALTAHAMSGDRERVLNAGFSGYISKPIDVPVFIPNIVNMLKGFPHLTAHFAGATKETH